MMTKALHILLALAGLLLAGACSSGPDFRIRGVVEDLGTRNLKVVYRAGGAVQSVGAPAIDGQFDMQGRTAEPALVEIYTVPGQLVGRLVIEGGDEVKARFYLQEPGRMEAEGNDASEALAEFLSENAQADPAALNAAIERYVAANPRSIVSAVLLTQYFDASSPSDAARAGRLLASLAPEAAPRWLVGPMEYLLAEASAKPKQLTGPLRLVADGSDKLASFDPRRGQGLTLLCFTDEASRRADSAAHTPRPEGLLVADVSVDADTVRWHSSLNLAKAHLAAIQPTLRYWSPGGLASPQIAALGVRGVPRYVLLDDKGRQLYNGPWLAPALTVARNH